MEVKFTRYIGVIGLMAASCMTDAKPAPSQNVSNYKRHSAPFMLSVANPYAAWIGKQILLRGGNAVDAAVAIQATLTLVEPESSGLGGGAFMLYWDNKTHQLHTFDGREVAPARSNAFLFLDKFGHRASRQQAVQGGRGVAVPGVLKMLEKVHQRYGKLPWNKLFNDTIELARKGFTVSPRLADLLAKHVHPGLDKLAPANLYFYPYGKPLKAGVKLTNPELANTLRYIAEQGSDYFYKGDLAKQIVNAVSKSEVNPGQLSLKDLAGYQALERSPVCGQYKGSEICGMGPPSSGGLTVLQMMLMLESKHLEKYSPNSLQAVQLFTQASRLAFADRAMYMADTDFTHLPVAALINRSYLHHRANSISLKRDMGYAKAGHPYSSGILEPDNAYEIPNTTHFSIVDEQGNGISMTSSLDMDFGSGVMVGGFLLNNAMTDFSMEPEQNGHWRLNRIEPGKRPRSSMAPTMVFDKQGQLSILIGSPGGSHIIDYVAQTLIAILDWHLSMQQAIDLPKVTNTNGVTELEKGTAIDKLKPGLEKLGHRVVLSQLESGLHGIQIIHGKLYGGADPRREGVVVSQ